MLVNKSFETEQGTIKFEGELSDKEVDFVLTTGLNYLLGVGAIKYSIASKADEGETLQ